MPSLFNQLALSEAHRAFKEGGAGVEALKAIGFSRRQIQAAARKAFDALVFAT